MFDFDIFIRAATEIQRVFRGYKSRRVTFKGHSFAKYKLKIVKIQRQIRAFLTMRRTKYV